MDLTFFNRAKSSVCRAIVVLALSLTCSTVEAFQDTDWPMFRGRNAAGVADGYSLPVQWNAGSSKEEQSGVLWETAVPGLGHSSPIVVGDKLYLATAVSSEGKSPLKVEAGGRPSAADDNGPQEWMLLCYDRLTGKEIWRQTAKQGRPKATRHEKATHANTSLTAVGNHLVAFFGSEGLYCYDLEGTLEWKKDLGVVNISKYGIGWGYASSPAVADGRIALVCDDPAGPFIVTLDLNDGRELWRVSRKGVSDRSWGTPLIHQQREQGQVVVNGWPWIVSYDLDSGKERWRLKGGGDNPVPTPFVFNDLFLITNAHGGPSPIYVIRPEATGDISLADDMSSNEAIVWSLPKGGCYLSTPVVYRDCLYLGNTNGTVRCFNAKTGESVFQARLGGKAGVVSSLVAGDGKIYCASENGVVYVLEAGVEFKLLAKNQVGQPCLATPAISQGVIYLRTTERLIAIGTQK